MHSFMEAKILAKNLRQSLACNGIERSHNECLELVAQQFGFKEWNQLSARIAAMENRAATGLALPKDWKMSRQTDRSTYRIGVDIAVPGIAQIACRVGRQDGIVLPPDSFGVMMQSITADLYRGRKLAFAAAISTDDADAASIWVRVDQSLGEVLRFDNMLDRVGEGHLRGTNDWTTRRVVLDIPDSAASIHYGLLLNGYGSMCVKDLTLDEAETDWPVTAGGGKLFTKPSNLDFSLAA